MTRRLVVAMTGLVALVAIALAVPMAFVVADSVRTAFVSDLKVETLATATTMAAQPDIDWQSTAESTADRTGARVVVVDGQLNLVADSDNSGLDREFDRPEITKALGGALTADVRPSTTVGEDLRYVAAPIVQQYDVVAAVRLSMPESNVTSKVRATAGWLVVFVISVAIAAALIAWLLARSIARPLDDLAAVASELPEDLSLRAREDAGPREVRSVARALNSTAERLGGILQRTSRVAADASHHLRTPLTGVRLRLEAIEDLSLDDTVRAEAAAATREVDRLNHRIDQVLALAQSDAGDVAVIKEGITALARERVDAAAVAFRERSVELEATIEPSLVAMLPVGLLARTIDELLGNALAYARTHVVLELTRTGAAIVLRVDDDGPGVPVAEQAMVFERFRRGAGAVPGGSGLGLALVRESVESAGGTARATTSPLGGLQVEVTIPG